jgi:hypothetical protein
VNSLATSLDLDLDLLTLNTNDIVVGFVVPYKITWYRLQLFHSSVLVYSVSFAVSWLVRLLVML